MARIQVEGNGKASAAPDEIKLQLTIGSLGTEYGEVIEAQDRKVRLLKDAFVACGVERSAIKTEDFKVMVDRRYDENNKEIFIGYRGIHELGLCFPLDRPLLNALLAECPGSEATPNIFISFRVRNSDALLRIALEVAFGAARKSAEILARSSGCTLGDLVEVLYGERKHMTALTYRVDQDWGQFDYCKLSCADEIEPEAIETSEKVSVTWELRA
jgi:hypothetical protein